MPICDMCKMNCKTRSVLREYKKRCEIITRGESSVLSTRLNVNRNVRRRPINIDAERGNLNQFLEVDINVHNHSNIGTSQQQPETSIPSWWIPDPLTNQVEEESVLNNVSDESFNSTYHIVNAFPSCKNNEGLSNADMDSLLDTLFNPSVDINKVVVKILMMSKSGKKNYIPKKM